MNLLPVFEHNWVCKNDVLVLSPLKSPSFEQVYLAVRTQEQRIAEDEQLGLLPETAENHPHATEWKIRAASCQRLANYLEELELSSSDWVLDIGCGNGWQSHILASHTKANVLAIDINMPELEQACRVFKRDNLVFAYLDLFANALKSQVFKFIVTSSCFQYFADGPALIRQCLDMLHPGGEFHINDSPFYSSNEIDNARQRSQSYYGQLGYQEMGKYYHHHDLALFDDFDAEFLYKKQMAAALVNPFPWIKIKP